jgi:hypothetical protein
MAFNKYFYKPKHEVWGREIEYIMGKEQFDAIANTRGNKNINPYVYVIEYINETFGLLGTVTALSVESEFVGRKVRTEEDSIFA